MRCFIFLVFCVLFLMNMVSGAHYLVGYVYDAKDGSIADGSTIVIWNSLVGIYDNVTDIVGPNGNSGVSNLFMVDCELLNNSCEIGEVFNAWVLDDGEGHKSINASVVITGSGFDVFPNITLNSPPNITSIMVDDSILDPLDEVDLEIATTRDVVCQAIVEELDHDNVTTASSRFYHSSSSYDSIDDNNDHYTNNSCYVNSSYGLINEYLVICTYSLEYYSNPGQWGCIVHVSDNQSTIGNGSDNVNVNTLLGVGLPDSIDFGLLGLGKLSNDSEINVTNYGNVILNLSLNTYALDLDDGLAMNCTNGEDLLTNSQKYNLTSSNPGDLTLQQADLVYENMTNFTVVREFNLQPRTDDLNNDAIRPTYWRMYIHDDFAGGFCSGNLRFGAVIAPYT